MHLPTRSIPLHILIVLIAALALRPSETDAKERSRTIASVLREPLPSEDISHSVTPGKITIQGPTYTYIVDRATGAIGSLQVKRDGQVVVQLVDAADIVIDEYSLASKLNGGKTQVVGHSTERITLKTQGNLKAAGERRPDLPYRLTSVFYNDGVVVSKLTCRPRQDLSITKGITYRLQAKGRFAHYLHKRLDNPGHRSANGPLPEVGKAVGFRTTTSCLQLFSQVAALAAFTDSGGIHRATKGSNTAEINVSSKDARQTTAKLTQHIVGVGPKAKPYIIKAGAEFTCRVGISIAPNRLPHPRRQDLRMFIWVGDGKHPYPTDREIQDAAQLGFTLFQMHRLGNAGEPRPPAKELDRVLHTIHRNGMLFLWTANADLMYASAKGVADLRASGKWSLWKGFNYGGKYKASMDPYCDLMATCLASPNGLAEYRVKCLERMMDKYEVDGMYIDDNLPYNNCTLAKEHNHPRIPYDCLIELHEMNWRRRQVLRKKCPHVVLVDHCSGGFILPTICDFDVHLFGEGYGFSSLEAYWNFFGIVGSMHAQGSMWAGDTEKSRCAAKIAYNYDLLTGGGQYTYLDWRLYPKKFPYASGVADNEVLFVRTYNMPQYYFGMRESQTYYFATSADVFSTGTPLTYATVYRNRAWDDYLIPIANMARDDKETTVRIHSPRKLGLSTDADYALFDVNERTLRTVKGGSLGRALARVRVPGQGLRLFYVRAVPSHAPYHLWGGKRIAERWDAAKRKLTVQVNGPAGLEDIVFLRAEHRGIEAVKVDGKRAKFFFDTARRVAHGRVRFGYSPVTIEAACSEDSATALPEQAVTADELTTKYRNKQRR